MSDDLSLKSIWNPYTISMQTPIGIVHMVGFMNLFGAHTSYYKAMSTMEPASEAQVHYAIDGAFK